MMNADIEALVRPNIRRMLPYSTARDECSGSPDIFLDANESPYPSGWNRYPDPRQKQLKTVFSRIKGLGCDNIFLGNGSDEAIDLIFRIFCEPGKDNAVAISPSYGMYSVAAAMNDVQIRSVRLEKDFSLDAGKVLGQCDLNTKAIFLCSPNNPSGNALERSEILKIVDEFHGIVVLDEAYVDFSDKGSLVGEIGRRPNLVVLQTCSKARGLAALRLGLALSSPTVIRYMSMVKYPYNINEATQKLALEALEHDIAAEVAQIKSERERLSAALSTMKCVYGVYPSDANFILARFDNADRVYGFLLEDGIIVRNRTRVEGCEGCLRITVGLPQENDRLLESLKKHEQ